MSQIVITRMIKAPVDRVFATVADIRNYANAVPAITEVDILTEQETGVGTRFREARWMKNREVATELEVTEYVENERVRLIADSHGAVWDSVFTVRPADGGTELVLTMESRAGGLIPRILNWLMSGMYRKALGQEMDAVKTFCEEG